MKGLKSLLALAIILILTGIIGVAFTFHSEKETVAEETPLDMEDFQAIDIQGDSAEVSITATDDQQPKIELSGNKPKQMPLTYDVAVENGTLQVEVHTLQQKLYQFDFLRSSLTLHISLPQKEYDAIKVKYDNGKIKIKDIQAKETTAEINNGQLDLHQLTTEKLTTASDNGHINVKAVNTESLDSFTSNGKMELSDVQAKVIHTETDNGKILFTDVSGDLKGKTSNGSITLVTDDLERMIDFNTDNGNILIETTKKPTNTRFEVNVDNGKVNIFDEFEGSTMFGDGDNLIKLTTSNGKVTVEETN